MALFVVTAEQKSSAASISKRWWYNEIVLKKRVVGEDLGDLEKFSKPEKEAVCGRVQRKKLRHRCCPSLSKCRQTWIWSRRAVRQLSLFLHFFLQLVREWQEGAYTQCKYCSAVPRVHKLSSHNGWGGAATVAFPNVSAVTDAISIESLKALQSVRLTGSRVGTPNKLKTVVNVRRWSLRNPEANSNWKVCCLK